MYRAYWAIPRTLKTSAGEQVNTVFGVASMLLTILRVEKPDILLLAFDAGDETFRHKELETYKEGRAETPDDFYEQIPRVMECVRAFGFSYVSDARFEADDFLCTYALAAKRAKMRSTIVTGDKDILQLVGEGIRMAIPHKGYAGVEYLDAEGVKKKYGVRPDQISAFKGLMGDASDNLPGVKGIGPKTAAILLQEHESLEGIYEHLDGIKESTREKLETDRDQAFFCQKMAQLVCDIPLPIPLEELSVKVDTKKITEFFQEMEFTLLLRRLNETSGNLEVLMQKKPQKKQQSLF